MFRTGLASSGKVLRREILRWGAALVVVSGLGAGGALAREPVGFSSPSAQVALTSLPPEAQATHRRILNGGPFPYAKDGIVFGNRERLLPAEPRGRYREYTVQTPGASNRGARRIVCSGTLPSRPEACYYTEDHYSSFRRIQQ